MNWLKKHIIEIVSVIVVIVSLVFLQNWVQNEPGKTIFSKAISNLPFLEFCNKIYKMVGEISGNSHTTLLPENSAIIVDVLKLLIASPIIMLIRRTLYKLGFMTRMPTAQFEKNINNEAKAVGAKNLSEDLKRKMMAREIEDYYDSVAYKIKSGFIECLITVGSLLFTSFVVNKFKDHIITFFSTNTGSIVGIILIVAFFLAYCIIFNKIYQGSFSFSIIKTLVFNIFPSIITTYISGVLYYCCHMLLLENRKGMLAVFFILLFIWCGIKDIIESKLKVSATAYRNYFHFSLSTFAAALCIYSSYIVIYQFNSVDIDVIMQQKYAQILFNFKALPFYERIVGGVKVIDNFNLTDNAYVLELLKLYYFAFAVSLAAGILKNIGAELSIKGFARWTIKCSIEIAFVFMVYSFLLYATQSDISKMTTLIVIFLIAAFILNIVSSTTNTTSNISFAPTNLILEALIIMVGEMILVFIAESVLDTKFLYMPVTITQACTIDDIMTKDVIIRMIIICVFMIAWYAAEVLNLNVQKKES